MDSETQIEGKFGDQKGIEEKSIGGMSYGSMFVNPDPFLGGTEFEILSPGDVIELNNKTFKAIKRMHSLPATDDRLVYLVEECFESKKESGEEYVAITNAENEHKVLEEMNQIISGVFPQIIGYNKETYQILITEYISGSIAPTAKQMDLKSLSHMIHDILICLEMLSSKGLCHRNISLSSICQRDPKKIKEGGVSFTLVGTYLSRKNMSENNQDIVQKSPVFCSLQVHEGEKYAYLDDLISLLLVSSYLWHGSLPWDSKMKSMTVKDRKKDFDFTKSLPKEFEEFWKVVLAVDREKTPPYKELIELIKKTM